MSERIYSITPKPDGTSLAECKKCDYTFSHASFDGAFINIDEHAFDAHPEDAIPARPRDANQLAKMIVDLSTDDTRTERERSGTSDRKDQQ